MPALKAIYDGVRGPLHDLTMKLAKQSEGKATDDALLDIPNDTCADPEEMTEEMLQLEKQQIKLDKEKLDIEQKELDLKLLELRRKKKRRGCSQVTA